MLEISAQPISLPARPALRGAASSPAVVQVASARRTFHQDFVTRSESRRSSVHGKTSLESHSCAIVKSNSFRMITFTEITSAPSALGAPPSRNSFRICTYGRYRHLKWAYIKPFRMILLYGEYSLHTETCYTGSP